MSGTPNDCFHLTTDIVLEIHREALRRFGGSDGIRDIALLESAVAAPQATVGGASPYSDLVEIAAAYLFYLCRNHAFIDGNKRVALGACLVFLRLNGLEPSPDSDAWEQLTIEVASSDISREEVTDGLREIAGC